MDIPQELQDKIRTLEGRVAELEKFRLTLTQGFVDWKDSLEKYSYNTEIVNLSSTAIEKKGDKNNVETK